MDESILQRLRRGDASALAEVARWHGPSLLRFLQRQAPAGVDAEDLVQETFLVLLRNARRLDRADGLAGYLRGIGQRLAMEAARKNARRKSLLNRMPEPKEPASRDPEVDAAVSALPANLQAVIDVYYSRDLTYEQAAELLGITRATFQSRLRRALTELRSALTPNEKECSS
ncbi:MAG: sigma-70 family RNA polymerase sigma factor [Planctomycetota bacterium]